MGEPARHHPPTEDSEMRPWLRSLFARPTTTARHRVGTRLGLDALEARDVPAVLTGVLAPASPALTGTDVRYDAATRTLTVTGTDASNRVDVSTTHPWFAQFTQVVVTTDNLLAPTTTIPLYRPDAWGTYTPNVTKIVFRGGNGDDRFVNNTNVPSLAYGDGGKDWLQGGSGADTLDGGTGDGDTLLGRGGNDVLTAAGVNAVLYGDEGDFGLDGGGNDVLTATGMWSQLYGCGGDDTLAGGAGCVLHGDAGNDILAGIDGLQGPYRYLYGDAGNDTLLGSADGEYFFGGDGDDLIHGGAGYDFLFGGAGNDTLYGDAGNDELDGGDGDDVLCGDDGRDFLSGGTGNDRMWGGAGDDNLFGDDGDDRMFGGDGMDFMKGGAGNDVMYGGADRDLVYGEDGDDYVSGDGDGVYVPGEGLVAGPDMVDGGAGTNTVIQ